MNASIHSAVAHRRRRRRSELFWFGVTCCSVSLLCPLLPVVRCSNSSPQATTPTGKSTSRAEQHNRYNYYYDHNYENNNRYDLNRWDSHNPSEPDVDVVDTQAENDNDDYFSNMIPPEHFEYEQAATTRDTVDYSRSGASSSTRSPLPYQQHPPPPPPPPPQQSAAYRRHRRSREMDPSESSEFEFAAARPRQRPPQSTSHQSVLLQYDDSGIHFETEKAEGDSQYIPIHYDFKEAAIRRSTLSSNITTASPRRDIVTRYMSSRRSRAVYLRVNAAVVTTAACIVLIHVLFSQQHYPSKEIFFGCFVACWILSYLRNPYGELVRAMGMTMILVQKNSAHIRAQYPSLRHVQSLLRMKTRSPFPPARNPWNYKPRPFSNDDDSTNDPDFNMLYALMAMTCVGFIVGGHVPWLPSNIGALALAGTFAFATTLPTCTGDLYRCMGMRVVTLSQQALDIQADVQLLRKFTVVARHIADKLLVLDRKHRIRDHVVSTVKFVYGKIVSMSRTEATTTTRQEQQQQSFNRANEQEYSEARRR